MINACITSMFSPEVPTLNSLHSTLIQIVSRPLATQGHHYQKQCPCMDEICYKSSKKRHVKRACKSEICH